MVKLLFIYFLLFSFVFFFFTKKFTRSWPFKWPARLTFIFQSSNLNQCNIDNSNLGIYIHIYMYMCVCDDLNFSHFRSRQWITPFIMVMVIDFHYVFLSFSFTNVLKKKFFFLIRARRFFDYLLDFRYKLPWKIVCHKIITIRELIQI